MSSRSRGNQPTLLEEIRTVFEPPAGLSPPEDIRTHRDVDKGHGRIEVRTIRTSAVLIGLLGWIGLAQVFEVTRERRIKGVSKIEVTYGITSLKRSEADAAKLLEWVRRHWAIENQLHYVRDVTMGEDACRVRRGAAGEVMAAIRNVVVRLIHKLRYKNAAAALRHLAIHTEKAVALVSTP